MRCLDGPSTRLLDSDDTLSFRSIEEALRQEEAARQEEQEQEALHREVSKLQAAVGQATEQADHMQTLSQQLACEVSRPLWLLPQWAGLATAALTRLFPRCR